MNTNTKTKMVDRKLIWNLCLDCASTVYSNTAPTPQYASQVAMQIFGIIAKESAFMYQRQLGLEMTNIGAWGLCQVEEESVEDSLKALLHNPKLLASATDFLSRNGLSVDFTKETPETICEYLFHGKNDALDILFARLHLFRIPTAVPLLISGQAADWKKWYNTIDGKGTIPQYIKSWLELCAPILKNLNIKWTM